jgi:hypothetical protein
VKITQVARFTGYINGGASGTHRADPAGIVFGTVGKVSSVTMKCGGGFFRGASPNGILILVVGVKEIRLNAIGLPRIDVGEEVMVHEDEDHVVAIQVIRNGEAIFRFLMPQENFRHGSLSYRFVD